MEPYIFDRYRPDPAWYLHDPYGLHGLAHAARVLVWAEQVREGLLEQGAVVDIEVVRWAAAVHDVGRISDDSDRPHGQRSADWARTNREELDSHLSAGQIVQVAYLCRWHVPADAFAPAMTHELTCLKDADGLDRVRIHDLNPNMLRTKRARALPALAQQLFAMTSNRPGDPWEVVRESAIQMGLWR